MNSNTIGSLPQIDNNVTVNPVQTAAMQVNALSGLDKIGNTLINKGLEYYSDSQQQKAIKQAYDDALAGKFSTVSGITGPNKQYNDIMNQVAPAIMTAQSGEQLKQAYDKISSDPNFNPNTAVQQYAEVSGKVTNQYLSGVPEQWRSEVGLTIQKQAASYGAKMQNNVLQSNFNQQATVSLQSINDLHAQATNQARNGNLELANKLNEQANNIVHQGINIGTISPASGATIMQNAKVNVLTQGLLAHGVMEVPKNIEGVSQDERDSIQSKVLAYRQQDDHSVAANQLMHGWSEEKYFMQLANGEHPPTPLGLSQEQYARAQGKEYSYQLYMEDAQNKTNQYQQVGNIVNNVGFMTPDQRAAFEYAPDKLPEHLQDVHRQYSELDPKSQALALRNIKEKNNVLNSAPVTLLNLEDKNGDERASTLSAYGIPVSKGVTNNEVNDMLSKLTTPQVDANGKIIPVDIVDMNNVAKNKMQSLYPILIKKVSDAMDSKQSAGLQFSTNTMYANDYLSKPVGTNLSNNKWVINKNIFNSSYAKGLDTLYNGGNEVLGAINGIKANNLGTSYNEIMGNLFDVYGDNRLAKKGDADLLLSPELHEKLGIKEQTNDFRYDAKSDAYVVYINNKPTNQIFTGSWLRDTKNVKPIGMFQRSYNYLNSIKVPDTIGIMDNKINNKINENNNE